MKRKRKCTNSHHYALLHISQMRHNEIWSQLRLINKIINSCGRENWNKNPLITAVFVDCIKGIYKWRQQQQKKKKVLYFALIAAIYRREYLCIFARKIASCEMLMMPRFWKTVNKSQFRVRRRFSRFELFTKWMMYVFACMYRVHKAHMKNGM